MKTAANRIATSWIGVQAKVFSMRIEGRVVYQDR